MLDIKFLRENPEVVKQNIRNKFQDQKLELVDKVIELDKALRANGISTSHPYVHQVSPTSDEGYRDMLRLLESKAPIADAYFADNDIIAAAAMRALRENGYRIPEDVSIIGFDDVPMCDMMVPPLSTMKVRKREL